MQGHLATWLELTRDSASGTSVPAYVEREIGLEMALDDAVERRALGATPTVDSAADLTCLRAVHGPVTSGWYR